MHARSQIPTGGEGRAAPSYPFVLRKVLFIKLPPELKVPEDPVAKMKTQKEMKQELMDREEGQARQGPGLRE